MINLIICGKKIFFFFDLTSSMIKMYYLPMNQLLKKIKIFLKIWVKYVYLFI